MRPSWIVTRRAVVCKLELLNQSEVRGAEQMILHFKCTVWCEVTSQAIIEPHFLEYEDGNAETVTGKRYGYMLQSS